MNSHIHKKNMMRCQADFGNGVYQSVLIIQGVLILEAMHLKLHYNETNHLYQGVY